MLETFLNQLRQVRCFPFTTSLNNGMLKHLALLLWQLHRLFRPIKGEFILVVFGPASDRQSHAERIKLEKFESLELRFELLDGIVHLVEARVVGWLPVHLVDFDHENFLGLHAVHISA